MTHSDKAALRGEPSYVWRSGQDRRLEMVAKWTKLDGVVLDHGCGLGAYMEKFTGFGGTVFGFDVEEDRLNEAIPRGNGVNLAVGEALPYPDNTFDTLFSNEVMEHVADDRQTASEMIRVLKPGGRALIFCPNRWNPYEQHGIYWRGEYKFGNIPLVNYLPDLLRDKLAWHVRAYTKRGLLRLFAGQPMRVAHYERVFGGYDNIERRLPKFGRTLRQTLYRLENTPLDFWGLSHLLVLEKTK